MTCPLTRQSLERVGYLPEERGLYKKMKVLDQLVFFGCLHGLSAAGGGQAGHRLGQAPGDRRRAQKKTEELSKGMQQKIQFIATLLHYPGLIVMDEPFSGLDPVNAVLIEQTLLELKEQGKAIVFSTHRMDQVEKLCDSICLINNGEAVLTGNLREIKSRYERNRVIVEFEGSSAFPDQRRDRRGQELLRPRRDQAQAARRRAEAAARSRGRGDHLPL